MFATVTQLWFPIVCLLSGILIAKLTELSFSAGIPYRELLIEPSARENATFVVLSRNSDVYGLARSIRSVEDRFNRRHGYDWIFLNDVPFNEEFINVTSSLVSGKAKYGLIPQEHWSYPAWIDQDKAAEIRRQAAKEYKYGDSESYRHMCRYFSGFFFQHKLLQSYDYYWRVEPDIELWCDINFDPFRIMRTNKKKISFVITLVEIPGTITTLWQTVKEFFKSHPQYLSKVSSKDFLSSDGGKTYSGCHFWSNFEIGSFDWLRSQPYQEFFNYLDKAGGFFYERWGDAPVHTIAAGLLLNRSEIHFFNEIGYSHDLYTRCPTGATSRQELKCHCDPAKNFDWGQLSCLPAWYKFHQLPFPLGYEEELPLIEAEERRLYGEEEEDQDQDQELALEELRKVRELRKKIEEARSAKDQAKSVPNDPKHDEL